MKLPLWPKEEHKIIDEDGVFVCFVNTTADRDYIIKTINSDEKLVDTLKHAQAFLKGSHIEKDRQVAEMLEQALKEAEEK